jgi:hypothetical protein
MRCGGQYVGIDLEKKKQFITEQAMAGEAVGGEVAKKMGPPKIIFPISVGIRTRVCSVRFTMRAN